MKKRLISIVQLALGVGLIAFIILRLKSKGDLGKIADALRNAAQNWPFLALGIGGFLMCLLLCALRWDLILKSQGLRLPASRLLELYFTGHFFNSFLLGSTGGDVVKAFYAARETSHKKTEIVSTIFIDRIIGLLAIIALMVIVALVRLPFFLQYTQTRVAMAFSAALLVGVIGGLVLVFRQNLFEKWSVFRALEKKAAVGETLRRAYDAFQLCFSHRGLLLKTFSLSLVNHVAFVVCVWALGAAIGISLPFRDFLTIVPTVAAVSSLPVTPGGLGTREGASIYLFGIFNVPEARAFMLSILTYSMILFWGIVGGFVYMLYAWRTGAGSIAEARKRE